MIPIEAWPARLEAAVVDCRTLDRARVLAETASTQERARELSNEIGLVVIAWRQTRGLGRRGQTWIDTGTDGVALTAIAPDASSERLALVSAVATALAIEMFLGRRVGIKWPNDIVVDGRKIAGILIERVGGAALVGIGANVSQREFPDAVSKSATSLALLGVAVDRIEVVVALVSALDAALGEDTATLTRYYDDRDALRGCMATFDTPAGEVSGEVLSIDVARGLLVRTNDATLLLPAATTTVRSWQPSSQ